MYERRRFRFGEFELDATHPELRRRGVTIPLQPRPLRLLLLLIENRERVVSKHEVRQWWGAAVTDQSITSALRDIRRALDDSASAPRWIRTRPKIGYRFIGEVVVLA